MPPNTTGNITQGQNFYQGGRNVGTVQYNPRTGERLAAGESTTTINPNEAINVNGLNTKETPLKVPSISNTSSTGLGGYLKSYLETSKSANDASNSSLADLYKHIEDVQSSRTAEENKAGLSDKQTAVTNHTNELNAEQRALQEQKDKIYSTPGISTEQANANYSAVERSSLSKQANIALLKSAAENDYNTTSSIIEKKINNELAPLQTKLEYTKQLYQDNKEQFTKAQDRAFQEMQTKDTRAYDEKKTQLTEAHSAWQDAAKNGAPPEIQRDILNKINNGDYNGAMLLAGKYAKDPLDAEYKRAQIRALSIKNDSTVNGTAGEYTPIDISKITSPNAGNKAWGGMTFNGLNNAAQLYLANNGKMPSLGLGSAADVKQARLSVVNYAGQVADALSMTLPQISALYKANSKAATDIINRVAKIDATNNTLANQFPRLAELADKVGNLGITESDLTAGKAKVQSKFGSVDAANYIELIQTIRGDYAAMQAAVGGARGGQFFAQSAKDAIPLGLTADQYRGLQQTIQLSAINSQKGTQDEANKLIGNIGNPTSGSSGGVLKSPDGSQQVNMSDLTPEQIQEAKAAGWK